MIITLAQEIPQHSVIRVRVTMVTIGARVTDKRGHEIPHLKPEDFSIFEDDVPQTMSFFSEQEQPVSLSILMDRSDSMQEGEKLQRAKSAALSLVRAGHDKDDFLYVAFDHRVDVQAGFTTDRMQVESAIGKTELGGGTRIYDALLTGLERFDRARHSRQAMVVITDGADQHSVAKLDQVIDAVQAWHGQVYVIGYFSAAEDELFRANGPTVLRSDGVQIDNPRHVFKRLAQESGTEAFFPRSDEELRRAVDAISADLKRQYTIGYYPTRSFTDTGYRRIRLRVHRNGVNVRARRGYRPPAPVKLPPG
ncbi:MAG TPA: VWA domain-containing protein [Acidobacteriota bacterium]